MNSKTLNLVLVGVLVLFALQYFKQCNRSNAKEKEAIALINALNDTLRVVKHHDSTQTATIGVINTESNSAFTDLIISNQEIKRLQELVKANEKKLTKPGSSAITGTIATNVNSTHNTQVVKTDTVRVDSLVYIYPTYRDTISDQWIKYTATMNKDTSTIALKIINDFDIVVGYNRGKAYADLTTKNPYSETKEFRVYQVKVPSQKQKRFGIGPNLSYGINQDMKQTIFIGVGLQYNLIRF